MCVVIGVELFEPIFIRFLVVLLPPPAAKRPKMGRRFRSNRVCTPDRKNPARLIPRLSRQRVLWENPETSTGVPLRHL